MTEEQVDEVYAAMGRDSTRFMHPPDGGDPTLAEMVANMREQLDKAETRLGVLWPADAKFQFQDKVITEFGGKFGKVIGTFQATGQERGYVVEFLGAAVATYAEGVLRKSR